MTRPFAWADLAYSLARHLESMPDGHHFALYVDDTDRPGADVDLDGHPLYVQFCAYDDAMVRCEVVSNHYLPADRQHDVDDLIAMRRDGWRLPLDEPSASPNIHLDVTRHDTGRAADLVVRVFREIWHVSEPSGVITDADFLRGRHAFVMADAPGGYATSTRTA